MNIQDYLKDINCGCGKTHSCDMKYVFVESGAISRLSDICNEFKSILIVADENTYNAAGASVEKALKENKIKRTIFTGKEILIPDEKAIETVKNNLDNVDLILGIGSGVIQDLCKYVSYFEKIPYMIVATAPSMDGYASTGAAMILKGMKETVSAKLPLAIIADVSVLKNAPMDMIKAGYGDIIGKYSALCDWRLANIVNGEYLCEYIYDITYSMIDNVLKNPGGIISRDEESIKSLSEALIIVGIMMSFAGSSRPASGSEHHLSHFFEIVGIVKSEFYFPHGIDVVYSTYITSKVREKILNSDFPTVLYRENRKEYESKIKELYGDVAQGCINLQDKTGNYAQDRVNVYKKNEKQIKELFASMPSSDRIEEIINEIGLDLKEFYNEYGKEKILNAVCYAKDLKDRYTVLWLNYDLFGGTL